jgi:hypothetical protein
MTAVARSGCARSEKGPVALPARTGRGGIRDGRVQCCYQTVPVYAPRVEGHLVTTMPGDPFGQPCAAHSCLRPRAKGGWCIAHWYAHEALVLLHSEADDEPDSLAICRAIWAAS